MLQSLRAVSRQVFETSDKSQIGLVQIENNLDIHRTYRFSHSPSPSNIFALKAIARTSMRFSKRPLRG